jgi:transposase
MPVKSVAIEACGMWRPAIKMVRELGYEGKLTSPKKTHDIACKKKTDKVDAKILADLLRSNFLPEVYIPNDETLRIRDLARHKCNITRQKTQIKCKVKSQLLMQGIPYSKRIWNKPQLAKLKKLDDPNLANWLRLYDALVIEEKEVASRINRISRNKRLTQLLMTMPGIAEYSALMILAEIADIKRFKSAKELVMYAGFCPGVYQTGNTERNVGNQAVNKWLKWIVSECSGRASIMQNRFQLHYAKMKQKKGFKVARRSVARKMITIIWHMLKKEEPYHAS